MTVEHRIQSYDTVQDLADQYLGDAARWKEIVDFNNLTYPYIVETKEERNQLTCASGYLEVTRSSAYSEMVLYKGSTFKTIPSPTEPVEKYYEVVEDTLLPKDESISYVFVRAKLPGVNGNTYSGRITQVGSIRSSQGTVDFEAITNLDYFDNGVTARILTPGELAYIPAENETMNLIEGTRASHAERIGRRDIAFGSGNPLIESSGDLAVLAGIENVKQAVNRRLQTEMGTLRLHPEYGTNLAALIGDRRTPFTDQLIEIELYEALSYEDRIKDVSILALEQKGTAIHVELSFTLAGIDDVVHTETTIDFGSTE